MRDDRRHGHGDEALIALVLIACTGGLWLIWEGLMWLGDYQAEHARKAKERADAKARP